MGYIIVADSMDLVSFIWPLLPPKMELAQNSVTICTYNSSKPSKVIDFSINQKRTYDFLLVIDSNYGPILHRF